MNRSLLATLSYALIFAVQVPLFLVGLLWYPELVGRMIELRQVDVVSPAGRLYWNLAMGAVIVAPMVLLIGPYQLAWQFWRRLPRRRNSQFSGGQAA